MDTTKYYVDESGDLGLFNRKGIPLRTSHTIMLGLLKIKEEDFDNKFSKFKVTIEGDPIFNSFPSFKKTKICFHAKDDHIAVKREVFLFIKKLDLSLQVVVRRRSALVEHARSIYENYNKKYTQQEIYNDLVKRLFKGKLHKEEKYEIFFSHRGNCTDNKNLTSALGKAKENFYNQFGINSKSEYKVICRHPHQEPGLQLVDYCLWALQRLYEANEATYFNMIEDKFKLIMDVDDKRHNQYGEYYNVKPNRLTLEKIKG